MCKICFLFLCSVCAMNRPKNYIVWKCFIENDKKTQRTARKNISNVRVLLRLVFEWWKIFMKTLNWWTHRESRDEDDRSSFTRKWFSMNSEWISKIPKIRVKTRKKSGSLRKKPTAKWKKNENLYHCRWAYLATAHESIDENKTKETKQNLLSQFTADAFVCALWVDDDSGTAPHKHTKTPVNRIARITIQNNRCSMCRIHERVVREHSVNLCNGVLDATWNRKPNRQILSVFPSMR